MLSAITRLFPLWALLLSVLAYYTPTTFTSIGPWVTTLLMLIMFGMGVHLKIDDFKRVLSRPAPVCWPSPLRCRRISPPGWCW